MGYPRSCCVKDGAAAMRRGNDTFQQVHVAIATARIYLCAGSMLRGRELTPKDWMSLFDQWTSAWKGAKWAHSLARWCFTWARETRREAHGITLQLIFSYMFSGEQPFLFQSAPPTFGEESVSLPDCTLCLCQLKRMSMTRS